MKTINEIQVCFLISLIAHAGLIGAGVFDFNSIKQEKPFEVVFEVEEEILPEQYEVKEEKKIEKLVMEKEEVVEPIAEELIAEETSEPEKIDEEFAKSIPIIEKEEIIEHVVEESISKENLLPIDKELTKSILRYQDSIKQKIQKEKQYPRWALRIGHEGVTRIVFNVLSSGHIQDLKLIQSSGFEELDKEALDAVKRASPFLSFPEELSENEIQIEVDIVFLINKKP